MTAASNAVPDKPEKGQQPESAAEATVNGFALLPFYDMLGYACFVTWAFTIGWDRELGPAGFSPLFRGDLDFYVLRGILLASVALATLFQFFANGAFLTIPRNAAREAVAPLLCTLSCVTLFAPLPEPVVMLFWFGSGWGQAIMFSIWGARLRILSRQQQTAAVSSAFAVAGISLLLFPFVMREAVQVIVTLLPWASFCSLFAARRRFSEKDSTACTWNPSKVRKFRSEIPFEDDRRFVVLKGLFVALYSTALGFVACSTLAGRFYPANIVVIGLANVAAATIMMVALKENGNAVCNKLPKLFLPTTSLCFLIVGAFWPGNAAIAGALISFTLYGCYEILNAYTAFAYSNYDAVRCMWELYSSKIGNAVGFVAGWGIAMAALFALELDPPGILALCFAITFVAVVVDTALFKDMNFEFHEVTVDDEPVPEITDPRKGREDESDGHGHGRGHWMQTCDDLAERYKLSPRQKEIFILLAKGRNVRYIKDELVVSTPTVKSHIYNIYQKMGIHSHQELLDLVEESAKKP